MFRFALISLWINQSSEGLDLVGNFNFALILSSSLIIISKFGSDFQFNLESNQKGNVNLYDFFLCMIIPIMLVLITAFFRSWFEMNILKDVGYLQFSALYIFQFAYSIVNPIFQGLEKFKILLFIYIISVLFATTVLIFFKLSLIEVWISLLFSFLVMAFIYLSRTKVFIYFKIPLELSILYKAAKAFTSFQLLNTLVLKIDSLLIRFIYPQILGVYTTIISLNEFFYIIPRAYTSIQFNNLNKGKSYMNPIKNDKILLLALWFIFTLISFVLGNLFYNDIGYDNILLYTIIAICTLIYSYAQLYSIKYIVTDKKLITKTFLIGLLTEILLLSLLPLIIDSMSIAFSLSVLISYIIILFLLVRSKVKR